MRIAAKYNIIVRLCVEKVETAASNLSNTHIILNVRATPEPTFAYTYICECANVCSCVCTIATMTMNYLPHCQLNSCSSD